VIVLVGGTTETRPVAVALVEAGYQVLVSTATNATFELPDLAGLSRRAGALDRDQWVEYLDSHHVELVVDVGHPYAVTLHRDVRAACQEVQLPYVPYVRPPSIVPGEGISIVASHEQAAREACQAGTAIFLTIGSRNLAPYVQECRRLGRPLVARVLDHRDSWKSCRAAGLEDPEILTGRGPFGVADNRDVIRRLSIGVVVTKDSGSAGGVEAKLQAAREERCQVVVVGRPPAEGGHDSVEKLVAEVRRQVTA
jgi:precorrin-6A/cobalt-precorrin-6A reductase